LSSLLRKEEENDDPLPLFDDLSPIVTTEAAFDSLRIPINHPSRSVTDTYYLNRDQVLRPHTSAHQVELLKKHSSLEKFLVVGDVYRRDEIDRSHYPVFHQMEGVHLYDSSECTQEHVLDQLKSTLEQLAGELFGRNAETRWVDAYFPFTHPSLELEVKFDGSWMEVLGCGVIHPQILLNAGRVGEGAKTTPNTTGWAFGLGLERWAMILFGIPDIRLFWSTDERFTSQFESGRIVQFRPYSKFPPVFKDLSFWLPTDSAPSSSTAVAAAAASSSSSSSSGSLSAEEYDAGAGGENNDSGPSPNRSLHVNDVYEAIRIGATMAEMGIGVEDWIEQVQLLDEFVHPKTHRVSHCYRITYRSMDRNLTNEEIDELQMRIRQHVADQLKVELR
jgi:phenylalanyl-tRNA synthetase alpha chain